MRRGSRPASPDEPDPPAQPPREPGPPAPASPELAQGSREPGSRELAQRSREPGSLEPGSRESGGRRALGGDLALYALSAGFAAVTAATSTLVPHRAWGSIALIGYSVAALVTLAALAWRPAIGAAARTAIAAVAWVATALLPLVMQAVQRAGGRTDRAQEEVLVIEEGGRRLLETGSPYLTRDAIAALPEPDRLLAYLPYQPGMATFGLPRAVAHDSAWWADARVWFALVTAAALAVALELLRRAGYAPGRLVRALQVATVLPVCALTLATGGDDLPVLALCLLAVACAAVDRPGAAGLAVGAAAALKLFAWPVAIVLGVLAATQGRLGRYAAGAVGLPVVTLLPVLLVDPGGVVENVVRFPLGHGLVTSPAQSPLPGRLIAEGLPAGRTIATALLLAAAMAIAVALWRRPPRTAAAAGLISGYGLLAAMLLMPSTRFGYLLYPAALLVWGWALRSREG